jgi:hypothetical protein
VFIPPTHASHPEISFVAAATGAESLPHDEGGDHMDPNLSLDPAAGRALTVDSPITLRLRAGSAVFAIRGEAWITQEGALQDVILRAGERFDVRTRTPLVISATRGRVALYAVRPATARLSGSADIRDVLRAHAASLHRGQAGRLLAALVHGARSLLLRARALGSLRTRAPTH